MDSWEGTKGKHRLTEPCRSFLYFLCSKSFVAFIYLFIFLSLKTFSLCNKKYFYAFCGVLVVSLAGVRAARLP